LGSMVLPTHASWFRSKKKAAPITPVSFFVCCKDEVKGIKVDIAYFKYTEGETLFSNVNKKEKRDGKTYTICEGDTVTVVEASTQRPGEVVVKRTGTLQGEANFDPEILWTLEPRELIYKHNFNDYFELERPVDMNWKTLGKGWRKTLPVRKEATVQESTLASRMAILEGVKELEHQVVPREDVEYFTGMLNDELRAAQLIFKLEAKPRFKEFVKDSVRWYILPEFRKNRHLSREGFWWEQTSELVAKQIKEFWRLELKESEEEILEKIKQKKEDKSPKPDGLPEAAVEMNEHESMPEQHGLPVGQSFESFAREAEARLRFSSPAPAAVEAKKQHKGLPAPAAVEAQHKGLPAPQRTVRDFKKDRGLPAPTVAAT